MLNTPLLSVTDTDEFAAVQALAQLCQLSEPDRAAITARAIELIQRVRESAEPTLMEAFLSEYGLSSDEGISLMCLAEALLRVPDADTMDDLIADKVTASDWDAHSGHASSLLVNASTWALMLTGHVLSEPEDAGMLSSLRGMLRRLGEPVVRAAAAQAMKELGTQFVLGQDIDSALEEAAKLRKQGYTFSFDMLGEGARTDADARRYHLAYADAITEIARFATGEIADNPGISVKLSALHPRYEPLKAEQMMDTLVARLRALCVLAAGSNIGLNIDAEEDERLELSLAVIERVLAEPALAGWDGFGVVVQAYSLRAPAVIDWVADTAERLDRKLMVRLVKGAYWDTEIKHAQVAGHERYPVFTRKAHTDTSYLACAAQLLKHSDRIYPQFATHNAHTVAAIEHLVERAGLSVREVEFQRLHGMGEALHAAVLTQSGGRCRIYAPVGAHRDLLAYLVRRLLENGANSSFVHQIVDERVSAAEIASDPLSAVHDEPGVQAPGTIFPSRSASSGCELGNAGERSELLAARDAWVVHHWGGGSLRIASPANADRAVGAIEPASPEQTDLAIENATRASASWSNTAISMRADCLLRAADAMEASRGELIALLTLEAGKTLEDGIDEVREAVDFLRYYASDAIQRAADNRLRPPRGVFCCISPWNFPLAIFTGQVAAALVTGNAVLAKPAEQTPLIAQRAVEVLHVAGIATDALQLIIGDGSAGAQLTRSTNVNGVCFTGSVATARLINQAQAEHGPVDAALIAETGGLNAMIVDSTALPEQAIRDIVDSAFRSAGQRCSALRVLYLQTDIAERFLTMLKGAMDELDVGDPWDASTDVGPIIDKEATAHIRSYLEQANIVHRASGVDRGNFVPPALVEISGIEALSEEIFGPVLHVARFDADEIDSVIDAINASGYGLTASLHTRLDDRVQHVVERLRIGNLYVNRNQIGAVVEAQPFGGEGLSGTGPKAGGPNYLDRFCAQTVQATAEAAVEATLSRATLQASLSLLTSQAQSNKAEHWANKAGITADDLPREPVQRRRMPGPTGERNVLRLVPRGTVLCLGPEPEQALKQAVLALRAGNAALVCCAESPTLIAAIAQLAEAGAPIARLLGHPSNEALTTARGIDAVAFYGRDEAARPLRRAIAERSGPLVRWIAEPSDVIGLSIERHVSTDTTAAGGNTTLMASVE